MSFIRYDLIRVLGVFVARGCQKYLVILLTAEPKLLRLLGCCCYWVRVLLLLLSAASKEESKRERETAAEAATWAAKAAKISTGFAPRLCDMYWLGLLVIGRPWRLRESWLKHYSWSLLFSPDNFSKFQISSHPVFITHGPADLAFLNYFVNVKWSFGFYIWHLLLLKASNWRLLKDTSRPFLGPRPRDCGRAVLIRCLCDGKKSGKNIYFASFLFIWILCQVTKNRARSF